MKLAAVPSSKEEKLQQIEHHFQAIMELLGLDLSNPSLSATPRRVAKMYVDELFAGLDPQNFPTLSYFEESFEPGSAIHVNNIALHSMCEHHFLPFSGKAHISYVPKNKILGLSKINRLVDYFSRRPQLQERLTVQIADALCMLLETEDVVVKIEAKHFCVAMRGIADDSSVTITEVRRGSLK